MLISCNNYITCYSFRRHRCATNRDPIWPSTSCRETEWSCGTDETARGHQLYSGQDQLGGQCSGQFSSVSTMYDGLQHLVSEVGYCRICEDTHRDMQQWHSFKLWHITSHILLILAFYYWQWLLTILTILSVRWEKHCVTSKASTSSTVCCPALTSVVLTNRTVDGLSTRSRR